MIFHCENGSNRYHLYIYIDPTQKVSNRCLIDVDPIDLAALYLYIFFNSMIFSWSNDSSLTSHQTIILGNAD